MAVIAFPTNLRVAQQNWGQLRFDLNFAGGDAGAQQSRVLGPPRWRCSIIGETRSAAADAALWRSLILSLRGRVNQLAIGDLLNVAPAGTARGTWTAAGAAAVGVTSLAIACGVGQAGRTILRGDWLGVNQSASNRQLLHVQADVTLDASGNGTVTFEPPLRAAVANGSAIVYDRPTCLMRVSTTDNGWTATRPFQGDFSLDLVESWE